MNKTGFVLAALLMLAACGEKAPSQMKFRDASLPVEKRVKDLMGRMSTEEKVQQITAQLLFAGEFYEKRNYPAGHIRNVGHFMKGAAPREVADAINEAYFDEIGDNIVECEGDLLALVEDYAEEVKQILNKAL